MQQRDVTTEPAGTLRVEVTAERCRSLDPASLDNKEPRQCWHHGPHAGDHNFEAWCWRNDADPREKELALLRDQMRAINFCAMGNWDYTEEGRPDWSPAYQTVRSLAKERHQLSQENVRLRTQVLTPEVSP